MTASAIAPVARIRAGQSTQPERVLMTADTVGGVWTYALDLCRALEPRGVRVDLATMGADLTPAQSRDAAALGNLTVHTSRFKLEWMDDPWEDVAAAGRWLLELEDEIEPDIVHLNGYAHGRLPFRAPVVVVGHSCVCSWWQAVRGTEAPDSDRYRAEVRAGLCGADVVAAPTAAMLACLHDHYGPLGDAFVIPNGRDGGLFAERHKEPFILCAGRMWDEAKNIGALDRVATRLPWSIYVAGDTRHPCGGETSVSALLPLGFLPAPQLANWLGRAAIYALPARYEPFGLSVLEAAMSGCALVLGDIPTLREVWGDAAMFVPPSDEAALHAALRQLIDSPDLRERMAALALRRASRYSAQQMADGYMDAYARVLPEAHAPRGVAI